MPVEESKHMIDRDHLRALFSPTEWLLRMVFWGGALAVGAVAVLFALGAQLGNQCFHWVLSISPWLSLVVMPSGLALSAWLSKRFFAGSQGSGIPQAIAALQIQNPEQIAGLLSLRIAAGKIMLTILALCCGASVGREGPTVQVGASIMYSLRRFSHFTYRDELGGLIVAGGAAGIAAAFNTPLAGIAFAIEELSRSFEQRTNGLVLTAVIFAGLAAHAILGNYTYFGTTSTSLGSAIGWLAVIACGVTGGLAGGLFARLLNALALGNFCNYSKGGAFPVVLYQLGCNDGFNASSLLCHKATFIRWNLFALLVFAKGVLYRLDIIRGDKREKVET